MKNPNTLGAALLLMMMLGLLGCSIGKQAKHSCSSQTIINNLSLIEEFTSKVPKPRIWFYHENKLPNPSNAIMNSDWGKVWHQQLLASRIFQNLENISHISSLRQSISFDEVDTTILQNANMLVLTRTEMVSATQIRGELKVIELASNITLYYGISWLTKNRQSESALDIITPRFFRENPERNLMFNFGERVSDLVQCSIKTMGQGF